MYTAHAYDKLHAAHWRGSFWLTVRTLNIRWYNVLYDTFGDNCLATRWGFRWHGAWSWAASVYRSVASCWQRDGDTLAPLSLYHSLRSPVGRPLDTSFANNVINYSFAWFRDADNRPVRQTEGRDSRSIRQPMERDSGSTYSWVSIAAAASTPLCTTVEPTSLRVAAAEFYDDHDLHRNPWLSTTCNLCYKVMMRAAWPFVTYRAPHNAVTWPVTQQALLSHADHVAANCNYRP